MNSAIRLICLLVSIALVSSALASVPARAQGPRTPDTDELVERVLHAKAVIDGWHSVTLHQSQSNAVVWEVALLRQTQTLSLDVNTQADAVIVRQGATPNVDAHMAASVTETTGIGPGGTRTFTLEADARRVDGMLYVNAQYTTARTDLPDIPRGWTLMPDWTQHPVLAQLPLDIGTANYPGLLLRDEALLRDTVSGAVLEAGTLADGTRVEIVRLRFEGEALRGLIVDGDRGYGAALDALLLAGLADGSTITAAVAFDADGTPRAVMQTARLHTGWIDAHALAPEEYPEGVQLRLAADRASKTEFSYINTPFEPVEAPPLRGY